jgi:ferredoxin-NADP reductase/Na+-translocating ferredoxin:NAD+ oxidoreductase RnfD subunit
MVIPFVDDLLNKVTMYKLVLWCLMILCIVGLVFSFFGLVPFKPLDLIVSFFVLMVAAHYSNWLFAKILNVSWNTESSYITATILTLVVGPELSWKGLASLVFLAIIAMASKYFLAINRKHVFNPAAFAMVVAPYAISYYPSWWIGNMYMVPFVLVAGFLIVRKIQREDLVLTFLAVFILVSQGLNFSPTYLLASLKNAFVESPILFFSMIMLTEPTTTPPTRNLRIMYGALTAFLLAPFVHIGSFYFSAESAVLAGNIFSYLVSPKLRLSLVLKEKIEIAQNTYDFIFQLQRPIAFKPGQYMEWTLGHTKQDQRGMRRYFTVASSPTEPDIRIGVKFYRNPSSYKKALQELKPGDQVIASQLAGDFTLPKDRDKKLVFLAGGIGITPFRSMIKYLVDNGEKRDVILVYGAQQYKDIAYREVFNEAKQKLGIKTVYILQDGTGAPADMDVKIGMVTRELVTEEIPDYKERMFYISGPNAMVNNFENTLQAMGVGRGHIKTDFFPGY